MPESSQGKATVVLSPTSQPRSLRSGFVWNLVASTVYTFSQWAIIWILARLGDPEAVGTFTLLMALSAPVFLTVGLNLRTVQLTDADRKFSVDDYFALRSITNGLAVALCVALGWALELGRDEFIALFVISIAKAVESTSLSCYGYYAVLERFDLMAHSMLVRAALGPVLFAAVYATTEKLWPACLALACAWMSVGVLDRRRVRRLSALEGRPRRGLCGANPGRLKALVRRSIPLGLDQGVSSYTVNVPRYGIEAALGTAKLGMFAGQAYFAQVLTMLTMTLAAVFVPRMARSFAENNRRVFVRDLTRMTVASIALSVIGVALAIVGGEWFLRVTLGHEYADVELLVVLMVSGGFVTVQRVLSKALEASHQFRSYLMIDIVTLLAVAVPLWPLMHTYGVVGAAVAMAIGFATGAVVMAIRVVRIIGAMPSKISTS